MDNAEEVAITHQRDKFEEKYQYYNSKEMLLPTENATQNVTNPDLNDRSIKPVYVPPSYIVLTENNHFFGTPVNTSMSSVHVPTNIYDRSRFLMRYSLLGTLKKMIFIFNCSGGCFEVDPVVGEVR